MKLCIFLHFYQPYNQQDDILNRIVNECYIPLTQGLLQIPRAKIVLNINGALTELLAAKGYNKVIDNINMLKKQHKIEFTDSAKYHAFLPLLPEKEIERQINANVEINKKYLVDYSPLGFFSPEMAINKKVLSVVKKLGYDWIGGDQVAFANGECNNDKIYEDENTKLKVFFRSKRISILMLSAICRDSQDLIKETRDLHNKTKYYFAVMDAETFGHHRIGHEKLLFDVLSNDFFEPVTISDICDNNLSSETIKIRASTWTNEEQDFWLDQERTKSTEAKSFILWKDPSNPIHKLQWELLDFAIDLLDKYENNDSPKFLKARNLLDKAEASDQFWWASAKPWWSLEMIEQGAHEIKEVINVLFQESDKSQDKENMKKAEYLYREILDKAFDWQRTGYIRKMHLANSGTYMKPSLKDRTPDEWFNQLILEFEKEMNDSINKLDFEKAIKWRDAIIKISIGTDKYDILHVLDELWLGRNAPWAQPQVKPFLQHEWEEFSEFAKTHFKNVKCKEDFDNLKNLKS